jgi:hypothetical protein
MYTMLQKGLDILKLTDELRWSLLEIKQLNQYTNTRLSKKKKKRKKGYLQFALHPNFSNQNQTQGKLRLVAPNAKKNLTSSH